MGNVVHGEMKQMEGMSSGGDQERSSWWLWQLHYICYYN